MGISWRAELLGQLDFYRDHHLMPRLRGLGDAEYFWEPVPDCWSIRATAAGPVIDWRYPAPEPPPVTTIAWRLAHLAYPVFGIRADAHFGDGGLRLDAVDWPLTAAEGVAAFRRELQTWRDGVAGCTEADLAAPVGTSEPGWEDYPLATLVLHLNRELIHHGAEIALLRDLYRARYTG